MHYVHLSVDIMHDLQLSVQELQLSSYYDELLPNFLIVIFWPTNPDGQLSKQSPP